MDKERSGTGVESAMAPERLSMTDFLKSPSSLAEKDGAASERLEEDDVDTVESEDEEAWVGWTARGTFAACSGGCCCCCGCAGVDLVSWRSCGVLEKAYGAIGAWVPL